MNNSEATTVVYIDAIMAFDTVNHEILIKKWTILEYRGNVQTGLHYLHDRIQCAYYFFKQFLLY